MRYRRQLFDTLQTRVVPFHVSLVATLLASVCLAGGGTTRDLNRGTSQTLRSVDDLAVLPANGFRSPDAAPPTEEKKERTSSELPPDRTPTAKRAAEVPSEELKAV